MVFDGMEVQSTGAQLYMHAVSEREFYMYVPNWQEIVRIIILVITLRLLLSCESFVRAASDLCTCMHVLHGVFDEFVNFRSVVSEAFFRHPLACTHTVRMNSGHCTDNIRSK